MARRKEKASGSGGGTPAWLVTFSDMMTLMLTFFVLLVSMAAIMDERRKIVVLGSLVGTFGLAEKKHNILTDEKGTRRTVEPGPIQAEPDNLSQLKPMVWEDPAMDLNFMENKYVQIFSIDHNVLFEPGKTELTARGREFLLKIIPVLKDIEYPLLLAGHTSTLRDEMGVQYLERTQEQAMNMTWDLSLARVQAVYRFMLENELGADQLRMEAFGKYHPRTSIMTPEGRQRARRVEIILDRRSSEWSTRLADFLRGGQDDSRVIYEDFVFEINSTGRSQGGD